MNMGFALRLGVVPLIAVVLAGCQPMNQTSQLDAPHPQDGVVGFDPAAGPLAAAKISFQSGDYGSAEVSYRKAVDVNPRDSEAWLGLAATYDQLRRFDLADQCYQRLLQLTPPNAVIYNNAGYSQLLRGNKKKADELFRKAHEMDPGSSTIANNVELLASNGT